MAEHDSQIFFVSEPELAIPIKLAKSGYGARPPTTVISKFLDTVAKHGQRNAMATKLGKDKVRKHCILFMHFNTEI
jgi:hypothetical protein